MSFLFLELTFTYVHSCSYGPKGFSIILFYFRAIFPDRNLASDLLRSTLYELFKSKAKTNGTDQEFWREANAAQITQTCPLIQLEDFFMFVVVPHVANCLILEDWGISEVQADEDRQASREYGDLRNPDDGGDWDEEVQSSLAHDWDPKRTKDKLVTSAGADAEAWQISKEGDPGMLSYLDQCGRLLMARRGTW